MFKYRILHIRRILVIPYPTPRSHVDRIQIIHIPMDIITPLPYPYN
jgi:hypothetical protein